MMDDPNLAELWRVKEDIASRFSSVREYAMAVQKLAAEHPLPPPGKNRKLIAGFPRGQSVADDDEIMRELRQIRKKLLAEAGGDLGKLLERANREAPLLLAPFRKAAEERAKAAARTKRQARETSRKGNELTPFRRESQAKLRKS